MNIKNPVIKGAFILTLGGLITRLLGFFYRIFLSRTLGSTGMGLYQLSFTIIMFCFSLCCAGIQTIISKCIAESNKNNSKKILYSGISLSLTLSLLVSIIVYVNAGFISTYILQESKCFELIRYLCLSIPLSCLHSCINGYYFGRQKATIPAVSQLIEQLVRVTSVYIIWTVATSNGAEITPIIAVIGTILGELGAFLVCFLTLSLEKDNSSKCSNAPTPQLISRIFKLSFPLTLNRVMLTGLQSVEAILIPFMLQRYGLTSNEALALYGVLTGMAISFIIFPSTAIYSLAVMLVPEVASSCNSNCNSINRTTSTTLHFCTSMGILCTGIFISYGSTFGSIIFNNPHVGLFISVLAWLCPFMYVTITLSSILNGLGKTSTTFFLNIFGTCIKLIFIIFLVPRFGILAYMWGLLLSSIVETFLHFFYVKKHINICFNSKKWIVGPIFTVFISIGIAMFLEHWVLYFVIPTEIIRICICCVIIVIVFLFRELKNYNFLTKSTS